MRIQDVMTRDVVCARPSDSIAHAAKVMQDAGVGILPVIENDRLCGVVTDRDIAIGCDACGGDARRQRVETLMTREVCCCHDDDDVNSVLARMAETHLRRLPVLVHRHFPRLVGIVSIDDIADEAMTTSLVKQVLSTRAEAADHDVTVRVPGSPKSWTCR